MTWTWPAISAHARAEGELRHTSWPALAADLQADKFDIAMGGVTETPARAQAFALSHPVVANGKSP